MNRLVCLAALAALLTFPSVVRGDEEEGSSLAMMIKDLTGAETWVDPETGIEWQYTLSEAGVSLGSNPTNPDQQSATAVSRDTSGAWVIPSRINGRPVTAIGNGAFMKCEGLTSVTIPDSVTAIGALAFASCTSLTAIEIPDSVTTIGAMAFANCSALRRVRLPKGLSAIASYLFSSCSSLVAVSIPEGVVAVEEVAFSGCSSLRSVTLPESLVRIGSLAFADCPLTALTLPANLETIDGSAFANVKLSEVTLPKRLQFVAPRAFADCPNLEKVTVLGSPQLSTGTDDGVFEDCEALEAIVFKDSGVLFSMGSLGCASLKRVTIPPEGLSVISVTDFLRFGVRVVSE